MSGLIIGSFGFQRSGKTLISYLLADYYAKNGLKVYTNMIVPHFQTITALTDIPFNTEPKVLLLDECYYFMDSRNWKNNTDASIFFNTIGKQNILLLLTAIDPAMIELRLRNQMNYCILVKSDSDNIFYKIFDVQHNKSTVFSLKKTEKLFSELKYDTLQVPDYVDCSLNNFQEKVKNFYDSQKSVNFKRSVNL